MVLTSEKKLKPMVSETRKSSSASVSECENIPSVGATKWDRFVDGFRRQHVQHGDEGKSLQKGISSRHLILISLVTGMGTGLFVGTGNILSTAGPLFLIIGYIIVGSFLYPTLQAAGELAVNYSELSGGYNNYPLKFIDESVAFAVTWIYCIEWLSTFALELVTASITIKFWDEDQKINPDVWVTIIFVIVVLLHFIGSKAYGEGEFVIGCLKVLMVTGFLIMSIVVNVGGGPEGKFIGGKYWHDPGYYTNFKGLCTVFVTGAFAFSQSEFVALSAAEQPNPRRAIPTACKLVFWRILILFLGSLIMVGLLVPMDSPELMGASGGGSNASPFVLAATLHGVTVVPHIINVVILLSVCSVASSSLYASSRTLQSLADQGYAPKYFNYIDRSGRPLRSLIACSIFGLFSYIAAYDKQETVFNWLLSISGLAQLFTWDVICISHIRFRQALKYNGISIDSLGYTSSTGVWGSVYAIVIHWLILVALFYTALFPVGSSTPDAQSFFQNYLGAIVLVFFYVCHKLWSRNWKFYVKTCDIDIHTDRTLFDEEILNLEKQEFQEKYNNDPWYKKLRTILF